MHRLIQLCISAAIFVVLYQMQLLPETQALWASLVAELTSFAAPS